MLLAIYTLIYTRDVKLPFLVKILAVGSALDVSFSSFEAFYFAITSLSAIGLGDFTPSFKTKEQLPDGENPLERVF